MAMQFARELIERTQNAFKVELCQDTYTSGRMEVSFKGIKIHSKIKGDGFLTTERIQAVIDKIISMK
jgi:hypothetical protein